MIIRQMHIGTKLRLIGSDEVLGTFQGECPNTSLLYVLQPNYHIPYTHSCDVLEGWFGDKEWLPVVPPGPDYIEMGYHLWESVQSDLYPDQMNETWSPLPCGPLNSSFYLVHEWHRNGKAYFFFLETAEQLRWHLNRLHPKTYRYRSDKINHNKLNWPLEGGYR